MSDMIHSHRNFLLSSENLLWKLRQYLFFIKASVRFPTCCLQRFDYYGCFIELSNLDSSHPLLASILIQT